MSAAMRPQPELAAYCGDAVEPTCGPDNGLPWCAFHAVDVRPAPFSPPADAAINVRDIPAADGRHTFVYDVSDGGFLLHLGGPTDGNDIAYWSTPDGVGYARSTRASKAVEEALANHPDRDLVLDVTRALLSRRAEWVWRDLITPERVAADHEVAYVENLRIDGRCQACGEMIGFGHDAGCPFDPAEIEAAEIEAAARRAEAIRSLADLDTRGAAIGAERRAVRS